MSTSAEIGGKGLGPYPMAIPSRFLQIPRAVLIECCQFLAGKVPMTALSEEALVALIDIGAWKIAEDLHE